jgi:hypothetical protein
LSPKANATEYIVFSLLAAVLLALLVVFTPSHEATPASRTVIIALFAASCLLGIMMTLKPRFLRRHKSVTHNPTYEYPSRAFRGHHPDCPAFQTHTLQTQDRTWCAGCLGLAIGMTIAIGLTAILLSIPLVLSPSLPWLLIGLLLILSVYLETLRKHRNRLIHLSANSLLAPGFALIVLVTLQHTGELLFGLFALLLCFLWTDTRIQLAYWRHHTVCASCSEPCKNYANSP